MTDVAAFPTIKQVVAVEGLTYTFKAAAAIKAGQVLALTSTSWSVTPCAGTATEIIIGVAIEDAASGAMVPVAGLGSIVYVCNGIQATNIASGVMVSSYGSTVTGMVIATPTAASGATGVYNTNILGVTLEANTASASGTISRVLITAPACWSQVPAS